MAIISQEIFSKFSEEEKKKTRERYQLALANGDEKLIHELENLFDKENLQPKPKIKTWEDVVKYHIIEIDNIGSDVFDNYVLTRSSAKCSDIILKKLEATYRIYKLIELGYGGMVTDEEWKDNYLIKYFIIIEINKGKNKNMEPSIQCDYATDEKRFIAFHTKQQVEEFMSYESNRKLIEQYYMICQQN